MRWNKRQRLLIRWASTSALIIGVTVVWAVRTRQAADRPVLPGATVEGLTAILARKAPSSPTGIHFRNVTNEVGVDFSHFPFERASLLPEDMGSGVACGDFDGDGFVDVFFVNYCGNALPGSPMDAEAGRSRLYRNVGGKRFEDVTESSGVGFVGYGMAAAWGDYDNDGDLDLYVTGFGDNAMYQNLGDGTFRNVTDESRTQDRRFSAGCAWGDYDRDGYVDLYVCNYVNFIFRDQDRGVVKAQYSTEQPYTLNPSAYVPQANAMFRNRGDGTFEEVAVRAGVADPDGRSLSASWVDLNNDGWIDLYVANDVSNNGVFLNQHDGSFKDIGAESLAADYRGAMGIAVDDFDGDLDQDIFITHWIAQENALYRNMLLDAKAGRSADGLLWFMDEADNFGLGQLSLDMVGWATGFADLDNDGRRDLWVVNGSTLEQAADHRRLQPQPPLILWNRARNGFVDVTHAALGEWSLPMVGRGGAQLDWDQDGRLDLIWVLHGGRPVMLHNESAPTGHWLDVALHQIGANTQALGARVHLRAGGNAWMGEVGAGSSYLSQHEPSLHFGVGKLTIVDELSIVWPDGHQEEHEVVGVDRRVAFTHVVDYSSLERAGD